MPPKREPSISSNNSNNNNENPTTSTNNSSTAATLQSTATTTSTTTNNNNTTTAVQPLSLPASALPMAIGDAAAEQRTVAYQANAKLCRLVRKCPWMYDRNHNNYAKKHILDKSWCKIARECNDSVASCKERWRNIRAAFARSINIYKTHSGPNRVKPYYLHKELSFLVKPMMEGRDKRDEYDETQDGTAGGIKDEENGEDEVAGEEDADDADDAAEEEEEDFPDDTADIKSAFEALNPDIRIQPETRYQKLLRNSNSNNINNDFESSGIFEPQTEFTTHSDAENEFNFPEDSVNQVEGERRMSQMMPQNGLKRPMHLETETFDNKRLKLLQNSQPTSENDVRFLEALLPDMALMNTKQKIVFKRKIYQTLEEVFENSNDFPNQGHNKIEHKPTMISANTNSFPNNYNNHNHNYNATPTSSQPQVRQTILTVNSSTARSIINNIANLNELELQKVNGFLQNSLRSHNPHNRMNNNNSGPSTAAVKLMSSTPKITITKVNCPPPAALRNLGLTKPPSPSPATVSTTIHNPCSAVISSNVHSTTSSNPGKSITIQNGVNAPNNNNNSPWTQLLPITIKDEIEDVDIV